MPVVTVTTPNSSRKKVIYNSNQRVNAKTVGAIPGLEDDLILYPQSLAMLLRQLFGITSSDRQFFGGDIASFSTSEIVTKEGAFLDGDNIYFVEALILTPTPAGFWGFYEIELEAVDSDNASLQFFDVATNTVSQQTVPTRKAYNIKVYENYNTTASFPTLTVGRIRWIDFKKNAAFGNIIEVTKLLNSVSLPNDKSGKVGMDDDIIALTAEVAALANKQIPLGASRIEDDFDELTPENGFVLSNAQAVLRSDVDAGLLAKLIKAVISINAGTDRINMPAHGLLDGRAVKFDFTLAGITAGTKYYIRNKATDDFQLSLTPSGSILDLTADATGNMMTNISWGFGNGSTTINVPDERALFGRGAGVHGTLLKANGSSYDGGAVGESKLDKGQGNRFFTGIGMTNSSSYIYGQDTTDLPGPTSGLIATNGGTPDRQAITSLPKSDGVNGTPRIGDETSSVSSEHNLKTRIR